MKKLILMVLLLAPMSLCAQKFGHFSLSDIMTALPDYTKAQTEIQALQKQYEDDLKRMQDELQKKSDEYDKDKASLPANIKQRREAELQDLSQRMQQSYQDNLQALQKANTDKMNAIQTKILAAVKEVGQAGGFVYIMDKSALPYISATLSTDVTAQVKAKLGLK
jgi:outer membrane protein